MSQRDAGTMRWFNNAKGYSFPGQKGGTVFVHFSSIQKESYKAA
jgi:cold shock CspA family protein